MAQAKPRSVSAAALRRDRCRHRRAALRPPAPPAARPAPRLRAITRMTTTAIRQESAHSPAPTATVKTACPATSLLPHPAKACGANVKYNSGAVKRLGRNGGRIRRDAEGRPIVPRAKTASRTVVKEAASILALDLEPNGLASGHPVTILTACLWGCREWLPRIR